METPKVDITINDSNKNLILVKTSDYNIIVGSLTWNSSQISKMVLKLDKNINSHVSYNFFHINYCKKDKYCDECENYDTLQLHVSRVNLSGNYEYENPNLEPVTIILNKKSIFIEVLEYNRKNEEFIFKCGEVGNIHVPFDEYIDPTPERRGKSILVGKT